MEIIPGILEKEWSEIERKLEIVKPFAKTVHIDLLDGKFAPNTTFLDPTPFKKYSQDIFFELHMMVEEPLQYLKPFAKAGFKRFLGHIEKMSDQAAFVKEGQLLGEVGLAIDGPTLLDMIQVPLDDLDAILVYTSKQVGFSGPPFLPERLEKVKQLREEILSQAKPDRNDNMKIEVDGGINDQTILLAKKAGANRFIATSFLFRNENSMDQYNLLCQTIG